MNETSDAFEAFQAFRKRMEELGVAYEVKISYLHPQAGKLMTYRASLWGDVEEP